MNAILLESVLFIALLAIMGALFVYGVRSTTLGTRFRQTANRKRIEQEYDLMCSIHGLQIEAEMVRLPTGERLCPHCYREAVHGRID